MTWNKARFPLQQDTVTSILFLGSTLDGRGRKDTFVKRLSRKNHALLWPSSFCSLPGCIFNEWTSRCPLDCEVTLRMEATQQQSKKIVRAQILTSYRPGWLTSGLGQRNVLPSCFSHRILGCPIISKPKPNNTIQFSAAFRHKAIIFVLLIARTVVDV